MRVSGDAALVGRTAQFRQEAIAALHGRRVGRIQVHGLGISAQRLGVVSLALQLLGDIHVSLCLEDALLLCETIDLRLMLKLRLIRGGWVRRGRLGRSSGRIIRQVYRLRRSIRGAGDARRRGRRRRSVPRIGTAAVVHPGEILGR